jgi:hypothetical protein
MKNLLIVMTFVTYTYSAFSQQFAEVYEWETVATTTDTTAEVSLVKEVKLSLPDTLYIQFLSTKSPHTFEKTFQLRSFMIASERACDFKYYTDKDRNKYILRVWGEGREECLFMTQSIHVDAFYINPQNFWRVKY